MAKSAVLGAFGGLFLFIQPAAADSVSLTFEQSEEASAVSGAEATNIYTAYGVRFPSRPTIQRDRSNQILQQGTAGGRPDPLPDRVTCAPLEMEFNWRMSVREVRMRVINRHLRSYTIQAFAGSTEVDIDRFTTSPVSGPPFPPITPYRDITLRASAGEGDITRVVANPPSDCFDLMVIDNLAYETLQPVRPVSPVPDPARPNRVSLLAYEVTQGVMSRLTRPDGPRESTPDTRVMARPTDNLTYVAGRDTGVRFFLGASEADIANYDANLRVTVFYRDGSRRQKTVTENTDGGRAVPVVPAGLDGTPLRRALAQRRARADQSLDYVIPGRFLQNAQSMQLLLSTIPEGAPLARVSVNFGGSYRMGLNIARVNGIGMDAVVGGAPSRVTTSLATQFMQDLYPVTGLITQRESGVLTMNTGAAAGGCFSFLAALDAAIAGTTAAAPIPGVNFWTNMYFVQNPPGCGGLGWYNTPGAMTNVSFSTAAHEAGHNIGINHATNQHNESQGGTAGDWEPWPYTHGSIGAIDETQGFMDGVYGVVMNPNTASSGLDMVNNWGVWTFGPIAPCTGTNAQVFPTCTAPDANLSHDYMSYGPTTNLAVWGQQTWISDINYHRALRWFQDCRQLDPPHRFMAGGSIDVRDTTGECNGAGTPVAGAASGRMAGASFPRDAMVFSGILGDDDTIKNMRTIRKFASAQSFANPSGAYLLVMYGNDGSVISSIPFAERIAPGEVGGKAFTVVAPYDPKLAKVEILYNQRTIYSRDASNAAPSISLLTPRGGEVWREGVRRIEWKFAEGVDQKSDVYLQYSPDKGASWYPIGLIGGGQTYLDVNVEDLPPSDNALLYLSTADGLRSAAAVTEKVFAVGPNAVPSQDNKPPEPSAPSLDFKEDCLRHDSDAIEVKQINGRWKIVQGNRWMFDFDENADEAKQAFSAMKRFGFDATCYIGRPDPSMTYLKKGDGVPGGSSQGLDCIGFDNASVGVRQEGSRWLLFSGRSRMVMFPNETEARQALGVIKAYDLNRHCFVGRPGPSFEYWLSE